MFVRKCYKYVDLDTINTILDMYKYHQDRVIYGPKPDDNKPTGANCYIEETKTELRITCCVHGTKTYIFKLDGQQRLDNTTGLIAYNTMSKYAKPQKCEDILHINPDDLGSCAGILYKNEKFAGMRVPAYSYDINSAFSKQMLEPLPDLTTLRMDGIVRRGEVGFVSVPNFTPGATKELLVPIFGIGKKATYIFKLMPSPYKRFVETWYKRKKCAKNAQQKAKAKMILNASIGYLQKINPFWRSCIIGRCNEFVQQFIDDNTIYCNTDCIVSSVRRPDIERLVGSNLGDFKFEHDGDLFAWAPESMIYQWNLDSPIARGIPKGWFKAKDQLLGRPFDLLKDELPYGLNAYEFDKEKFIVKESKHEDI